MEWQKWVEHVGEVIDVVGVAVMVIGLLVAVTAYLRAALRRTDSMRNYRDLRQGTGRAILLGLEFLVAGDIIRTVATDPTFTEIGILAAIVLIRSFLSFTLELEVTGRWPWQQDRSESAE